MRHPSPMILHSSILLYFFIFKKLLHSCNTKTVKNFLIFLLAVEGCAVVHLRISIIKEEEENMQHGASGFGFCC